MADVELLTFASFSKLVSLNGLYVTGFAWLYGMSVWVSFFGGVIAYKALPRQQFGLLQHKTFPVYFVMSILLSSVLLGLWTKSHPNVVAYIANPVVADVAQAYVLASVSVVQGLNHFVIGPLTSKTMFERHRQEKTEGKAYNEADVSSDMKTLNKRFAQLHGISSLANLWAVIALSFHGLWIGSAGVA
ncbi:hypothetical protein CPB85DRAFT_1266581 [Mucidula mucida]|nr:hypothetical protein CPB85DRAFT_1266581 [Mucidula mucida]